ncbi:unnamed protein product [Triticum turgidum subsp. durum]|uniref:Uncharacterized protein n=1 Tax=Triticum turgidum subsp. durum TaxID=4567 RepID=A0A9R0ZUG6_TRITD|nr:unnamed protein product [Triticum turgidum subsp. durum]
MRWTSSNRHGLAVKPPRPRVTSSTALVLCQPPPLSCRRAHLYFNPALPSVAVTLGRHSGLELQLSDERRRAPRASIGVAPALSIAHSVPYQATHICTVLQVAKDQILRLQDLNRSISQSTMENLKPTPQVALRLGGYDDMAR